MTRLENIRSKAQAAANADKEAKVILNLNPYSPSYIIRRYIKGCEVGILFVESVYPECEPHE